MSRSGISAGSDKQNLLLLWASAIGISRSNLLTPGAAYENICCGILLQLWQHECNANM